MLPRRSAAKAGEGPFACKRDPGNIVKWTNRSWLTSDHCNDLLAKVHSCLFGLLPGIRGVDHPDHVRGAVDPCPAQLGSSQRCATPGEMPNKICGAGSEGWVCARVCVILFVGQSGLPFFGNQLTMCKNTPKYVRAEQHGNYSFGDTKASSPLLLRHWKNTFPFLSHAERLSKPTQFSAQ